MSLKVKIAVCFLFMVQLSACGGGSGDSSSNENNQSTTDRGLVTPLSNGAWKGNLQTDAGISPTIMAIYEGKSWGYTVRPDGITFTFFGTIVESNNNISGEFGTYAYGGYSEGDALITGTVVEKVSIKGVVSDVDGESDFSLFWEQYPSLVVEPGMLSGDWNVYNIENDALFATISIDQNLGARAQTPDGCDFTFKFKDTEVNGMFTGEFSTPGCSSVNPGSYRTILVSGSLDDEGIDALLFGVSPTNDPKDGTAFAAFRN